jgi:6-pyruvoyltetrahydropterin/6-carboxytetrahydropterin synthase
MYSVRVEAGFAAAHSLTHYHGKCERLHGHNYRVLAWARGEELGEGGMLIDFILLKGALREIVGELDHTNLNDEAAFSGDPSAERIARLIFDRLEARLVAAKVDSSALFAVEVYETPTSMARYERDAASSLETTRGPK